MSKTIYQWYYSYYNSRLGRYQETVFAYSDSYGHKPSYPPSHLKNYSGNINYHVYMASNNEMAFLVRHNGIYFTNNLTNSVRQAKQNIERRAVDKYVKSKRKQHSKRW